jgi:hypothetical protein
MLFSELIPIYLGQRLSSTAIKTKNTSVILSEVRRQPNAVEGPRVLY